MTTLITKALSSKVRIAKRFSVPTIPWFWR
jgi:hypothetical protein